MTEENSKLKYLENVPSQNYFGFSDGKTAKNLENLYDIIKDSADQTFYDHVNDSKNDFANWIKYCIFYIELADRLSVIKDRKSFLDTLEKEIETIKSPARDDAKNVSVQVPAPIIDMKMSKAVAESVQPAIVPTQQPAAQPSPTIVQNQDPKIDFKEEVYDFEEVFRILIDDLEHEIMASDS